MAKKEKKAKVKGKLHKRNPHKARYDLAQLSETNPELAGFVRVNKYGDDSIDFGDSAAVRSLNRSLLMHFYKLEYWDIPKRFLTPAIPGRADYLHNIADLLAAKNDGVIPKGEHIRCLDIGVGANCVYPIIGQHEYGWSFIGSDIEQESLDAANDIIRKNPHLHGKIEFRLQPDKKLMYEGIIRKGEFYDLVICNPPFHANLHEARYGSLKKNSNLEKEKLYGPPKLNFEGKSNELWYKGGEKKFIRRLIEESETFGKRVFWFSSLVSKHENVDYFCNLIEDLGAYELNVLKMGQGNKRSRVLAWTFLSPEAQESWAKNHWTITESVDSNKPKDVQSEHSREVEIEQLASITSGKPNEEE